MCSVIPTLNTDEKQMLTRQVQVLVWCRHSILTNQVLQQEKSVFIFCCSLIPSLTGQLHPNRGACEQASKMFRGCSSEDKIKAIKICLFIFTKRLLLKCFSDSGATTPMIVFNTCISVVCNPSGVYCDSFKTAVRPCILTVNKPPKLLSLMYNSTDCSTPTK